MISDAKTVSLIRAALKPEARPSELDSGTLRGGDSRLVRSLPFWVGRFGFLTTGADQFLLWCKPRPSPGETFSSQFILDVPRGRWFVEIFDPVAAAWMSRESAEGGPLVAGLPFSGNALLARIRTRP
jgi:hypothetical protein